MERQSALEIDKLAEEQREKEIEAMFECDHKRSDFRQTKTGNYQCYKCGEWGNVR